ncbi:hypothetical protein M407DRAFT_140041 [Tulasnella calospora MUT 4182]|uniref:Uncharacterized protein n=1 Tax=Tulasnella calospora MUT 4182 TaxID=1051891 RepID=A0A0C3PY93_9AGAM|nr:hypothetical protein M407DRAFT_140041 [Tulasnella calospora MUT 4182]
MDPATALHQPPQDAARYIFDQTQYALHHQGDSWSTPSQPPYHASVSDHSASHVPEPSSVSPKSANKHNNGKPSSPAASGRMTRNRAAALAKGSNHQLSPEEGEHLPAVSINGPHCNQFPSSTQQHVLHYFLPSPSLLHLFQFCNLSPLDQPSRRPSRRPRLYRPRRCCPFLSDSHLPPLSSSSLIRLP